MTGLRDALRERLARQPPPASPAAAGSRAALPPPNDATASDEADMAELVERMHAAARQAGIDDDGPMTPLLEAFVLTLTRLGTLTDRNARISADHATALAAALDQARRAADAETARFRAGLDTAKAETIRDVANHIARSADAALTRRVRVVDRNSVLIAAAVLAGSILVAGVGGYWWGQSSATAAIRETEVGLRAAFNNGPTAARDWLNLMTWNDVTQALSQCQGDSVSTQGGRRACNVPLWVEKPVSPPPPQAGE